MGKGLNYLAKTCRILAVRDNGNGTIHPQPKSEMRDRVRDIELGKQNLRFLARLCITHMCSPTNSIRTTGNSPVLYF